jgi:cation diffusion facilitator family transporter
MEKELILRDKEIKKVLYVTLGFNIFVAFLKLGVGYKYNLFSLITVGLDSLFDGSSNILALISIYFSIRPADPGHNYGHYKFETLGSLMIGMLLLFSSFQLFLNLKIFSGEPLLTPTFGWLPVVTIIFSAFVSLFISKYEKKKGEVLGSSILLADADHTFGDFILSFGVLLSLLFSYFKIYWVDLGVGVCTCLYLFYLAIVILRRNLPDLLDASPYIKEKLVKKVEGIKKIKDIHRFRARGNKNCMYVDFHLLMDEELSLKEAHQIGHRAEDLIKELLKSYAIKIDVTVHIEPYEENHRDD